jgi:hypothetical protein
LLDFGDRFYGDRLSGSTILQNISGVPLAYRLNVPKHCTFLDVSIDGTNRTLSTGQQQFEIQIIPGLPRKYKERFFFQIGQFTKVEIGIRVNCCFPQLTIVIPRALNDPIMNQGRSDSLDEK